MNIKFHLCQASSARCHYILHTVPLNASFVFEATKTPFYYSNHFTYADTQFLHVFRTLLDTFFEAQENLYNIAVID